MMLDFKKEWLDKAELDFFPPFISLWLACNSWYVSHYSELGKQSDRQFINLVKSDYTNRNHLYKRFSELLNKDDKDGISFRTDIELLHYSLENAELKPKYIITCSFRQAVIDFQDKNQTIDLIKHPKIKKDGTPYAKYKNDVIRLDKLFITSDEEKFFSGLIEIIYQVRNLLIHGNLKPDTINHDVVKYCYRVLWAIMN